MKIITGLFLLIFSSRSVLAQTSYYYPENDIDAVWETTDPEDLNWCADQIDSLYSFLQVNNTKGFIVLKAGKIVLERYFDNFSKDSLWYWASAAKSLTAVLIGFAQEDGLLQIQNPTNQYLGAGWTSMAPDEENQISIYHQLSMTTGIDDSVLHLDCLDPSCLEYLTDPGERWAYHNAPYRLLLDVIESASGKTINGFTNEKFLNTIGMRGFWLNYVRYSRTRDLARFGHFVLSKGIWAGDTLLYDLGYLNKMVSPSQSLNPAYGLLWWLNGQSSYMYPRIENSFDGPLFPLAPQDMFSAQGKNDQKIYVIPSMDMVVVRVGNNAFDIPFLSNSSFDNQLWSYMNQLECSPTETKEIHAHKYSIHTFPNPASDFITIQPKGKTLKGKLLVIDQSGRFVFQTAWPMKRETLQLNIRSLSHGIYFLQFENGQSGRFLKQ